MLRHPPADYFSERNAIEHKTECLPGASKVAGQSIVSSAATYTSARTMQIDLQRETSVVIEVGHIAKIDLEIVVQTAQLDPGPHIFKSVQGHKRSIVVDHFARSIEYVSLTRQLCES